MTTKVTCYLDTQDYSTLTDPKLSTPELRKVKEALMHLARSHQVLFVFSAAVICESVPLTPESVHLAELKADLVSELCCSNALMSFDRLLRMEVTALAQRSAEHMDAIDPRGRWFPEIPENLTPESPWEYMQSRTQEDMKSMGLSRQQRRAKEREIFKNGKPRGPLLESLNNEFVNTFVTEVCAKFPMHPEYAQVMVRYAIGQATEADFNDALMNSLSDPRWMMRWFRTEHGMSSPVSEIVRAPGRDLGSKLRDLANHSQLWANNLRDAGVDADPTGKKGAITIRWAEMVDYQLISLARASAERAQMDVGDCCASDVLAFCPGLSVCIRSLFSSVWTNVGEGRKEAPSDSQPVDALHALYAPYVSVFRADRFMAPHIKGQLSNTSSEVVSKLSQLVDVLDAKVR